MSTPVSPIDKDARAIVALGVWKKASVYNWVLSPQTSEEPIVVHVESKNDGPVAGRIFFFPGFAAYRDFALLLQAPDAGIALSPLDVTHWELIGFTDGRYEMHSFRTGYAPHLADADELTFLAPLVHECLGLLMRFEEDFNTDAYTMNEIKKTLCPNNICPRRYLNKPDHPHKNLFAVFRRY